MSLFSDVVIRFFLNTGDAKQQLDSLQGAFVKTADKIQNNFITKLGGLALGAAGIKGLTGIYDEAVKIQNLAETWNLPVEKVSQFANAFNMLGGSTEEAIGSVDKLQNLANQLKFDSSGSLRELSARLGTNLFNKDFKGAIDSIRQSFKGLNGDTQKKVLDMLGTDNLPMLRMLKMSDEEYKQLNKDAAQYGIVTQKSARAIRNMEMAFGRVKTAIKGVFIGNLEKLIPLFDKISEKLTAFSNLAPETKQKIVGITSALVGLAPALKLIGTLGGAVFSPMTIGIAAVAAGAFLLYENWDKVNKAFQEYLADSPNLQKFIKQATVLFNDLKKGLKSLFDWISQNAETITEFFKGFFEPFEKFFEFLEKGASFFGDKFGDAIADLFDWGDISKPVEYKGNLSSDPETVKARMAYLGKNYPDYNSPRTINDAKKITTNNNRKQEISGNTIVLPNVKDAEEFAQELAARPVQVRFGNQTLGFNMVGGIRR